MGVIHDPSTPESVEASVVIETDLGIGEDP
jgi:hypothetical protein